MNKKLDTTQNKKIYKRVNTIIKKGLKIFLANKLVCNR